MLDHIEMGKGRDMVMFEVDVDTMIALHHHHLQQQLRYEMIDHPHNLGMIDKGPGREMIAEVG